MLYGFYKQNLLKMNNKNKGCFIKFDIGINFMKLPVC